MANAALRIERLVAIVFAICLIGACAVHMADLLRHGWLPYRFAPLPLNVYWTSLTFFDALAAVLLLCSMRIGLFLTLVIISSDVALNLFARFGLGKAFMEYSFGKVPDKLETNPLEERKTLILHYGHEFKRLQEREGFALGTQDDSKK